eukprot:3255556-Pleurochrysis_carterae.AAC.1
MRGEHSQSERKVRVPHCKENKSASIKLASIPHLSWVSAIHEEKPRVWRAETPRGGTTRKGESKLS